MSVSLLTEHVDWQHLPIEYTRVSTAAAFRSNFSFSCQHPTCRLLLSSSHSTIPSTSLLIINGACYTVSALIVDNQHLASQFTSLSSLPITLFITVKLIAVLVILALLESCLSTSTILFLLASSRSRPPSPPDQTRRSLLNTLRKAAQCLSRTPSPASVAATAGPATSLPQRGLLVPSAPRLPWVLALTRWPTPAS